ncbi:MAG: hypothetical protein ABI286_02540 [Edaphobacter sp.]
MMIRLTPDQWKKGGVIGAFVLVMAGVLYYELWDDGPTAPVAAPVVMTSPSAPAVKPGAVVAVPPGNVAGAAAKSLGTTAAQLDPTLRMEAMLVTESLVYSGSGRNIFSASSVPVDIPKPIASVRVKGPVGPVAPPPPPGPPPPPPIDLKFFGTASGANGKRMAFLLHGEDVYLATDGEIVQRKYKVISVLANSIVVEDLTNNNRQTLPLLAR